MNANTFQGISLQFTWWIYQILSITAQCFYSLCISLLFMHRLWKCILSSKSCLTRFVFTNFRFLIRKIFVFLTLFYICFYFYFMRICRWVFFAETVLYLTVIFYHSVHLLLRNAGFHYKLISGIFPYFWINMQ